MELIGMSRSAFRHNSLLGFIARILLFFLGLGAFAHAQNSCVKKCLADSECSSFQGRERAQCSAACTKKCNPTPPPPPLLDPRCDDRTKTGKFNCTIDRPAVDRHDKAYPQIQFAPRDIVEVHADGCVQTGGWGDTWKRYVTPTGGETDTKYHGLIRIPTAKPAGSGFIRLEKVIGKLQTVTGDGVPLSQLFLTLGYEDSDYSDNGYDNHDDGNDGQCRLDGPLDGGPAHVTITICRGPGVDCGGAPTSYFDFDVLSGVLDSNGLPVNPQWSWQQRNPGHNPDMPSTSICHEFSYRPTVLGIPQLYMAPSFADCTDQADPTSSVDLPDGLNNALCKLRKGGPFASGSFVGHVNWFPVTIEGRAGPIDHNADDDYSFTFNSDTLGDPLSVNNRGGMHVEFDSDETIDNFHSQEWQRFHDAVDGRDSALGILSLCNNGERRCTDAERKTLQDAIDFPAQFFAGHTVMTGMFGMDGEHDLKSEMHPLFAMATRRDKDLDKLPGDDIWFIFVRNRGDEGFCSSQLWDSGFEDYTVRLPWLAGMTSVDVAWDKNDFEYSEGASGPTVSWMAPMSTDPGGVFVTFHLGPAATSPFIDGTLHLIWTGSPLRGGAIAALEGGTAAIGSRAAETSPGSPRHRTAASDLRIPATAGTLSTGHPAVEVDEVEQSLKTAMEPLTLEERQQIQKARAIEIVRPKGHRLAPTHQIQRITTPPRKTVRIGRLHAIKAGPASRKAQRDTAMIHAICAATHNAPSGLPAEVCKGPVRDHR